MGTVVLSYYKLREQPFGVTPNPKYFYASAAHREALLSLIYGIQCNVGFAVLLSEPGQGKTTLLYMLLEHYRTTAESVYIFNTQCSTRNLLRQVSDELDLNECDDAPTLLINLREHLTKRPTQKPILLIVDEAQNLDESVLETVRLLSNFETPQRKLLHIILSGQPELAHKLNSPKLVQLAQRITMVSRLRRLSLADTQTYIQHRLEVAGYRGPQLFAPSAIERIYQLSQGTPRKINRLCFNALMLGCAEQKREIVGAMIDEVARDLDFSEPATAESEQHSDAVPTIDPVARTTVEPESTVNRRADVSSVRKPEMRVESFRGASNLKRENSNRTPAAAAPKLEESRPVANARPARKEPVAVPVGSASSQFLETSQTRTHLSEKSKADLLASRQDKTRLSRSFGVLAKVAAAASLVVILASAAVWQSQLDGPATPNSSAAQNRPLAPVEAATAPAEATEAAGNSSVEDKPVATNSGSSRVAKSKTREAEPVQDESVIDLTEVYRPQLPARPRPSGPDEPAPRLMAMSSDVNNDAIVSVATSHGSAVAAPMPTAAISKPTSTSVTGENLVPLTTVKPIYPHVAKMAKVDGMVLLTATVSPAGTVQDVQVAEGNPILASAAADALKRWKYPPLPPKTVAMSRTVRVVINFKLN